MSLRRFPKTQLTPNQIWAREQARARRDALEARLDLHIHAWGLPEPQKEFHFHPEKGWRFDRAWPELKVAVEVEGLPREGFGRHQRKAGFEEDALKYSEAQRLGWTVLRFTAKLIKSAYAVRRIEDALQRAGWGHVR